MTSDKQTAKPLYVYLQRPDTCEWITVGRYLNLSGTNGSYRYAPTYVAAGHRWNIDPVNLRLLPGVEFPAPRYGGLHDVLRDACPDAWGKSLIAKKDGISLNAPDIDFLLRSGNSDRWGALAVGNSKTPNVNHLSSPKLTQLHDLVIELLAISENRDPVYPVLRKKLFASASSGGARPKLTVQDGETHWLVKPGIATDTVDLALLEHVSQLLGKRSGLSFADTVHHPIDSGKSVVRIRRFDRNGAKRILCVSAASLLQVTYPPLTKEDVTGASYPRLADTLKAIGAPPGDRIELFGRMVFNVVIGNDDDHARNHAITYDDEIKSWKLSPAFDVVPNPEENPNELAMQICTGSRIISRENIVSDFLRFGFESKNQCEINLENLLQNILAAFTEIGPTLSPSLKGLMERRLEENISKLSV